MNITGWIRGLDGHGGAFTAESFLYSLMAGQNGGVYSTNFDASRTWTGENM